MSTPVGASGANSAATSDRGFFGHPRGLSTLFFTEMWERFSYYGLRPLLVLFMSAALAEGGFRIELLPRLVAGWLGGRPPAWFTSCHHVGRDPDLGRSYLYRSLGVCSQPRAVLSGTGID